MIAHIDSVIYISAVLGISLLSWLVRSFVESKPDSFLLNFTFFAFAGQCVFTAERILQGTVSAPLVAFLLIGLSLLLFQVLIFRAQAQKTLEHYQMVLKRNKIADLSDAEAKRWATILLRVTGVDFYPEFYLPISKGRRRGPRHERRREAISVLPSNLSRCGEEAVTPDTLLVPAGDRRWLWRLYAYATLWAWMVFVASILVATRNY